METVLQGVLDSARLLVGARCGLIYLVSSQGRIEENVYSGITSEQARQLWEMPHAVTFQSHVDELEETFRIPDLHSHIAAVGLPEFQPPFPVNPVMPLLAVSILYRGDRVGAIYLGDKEPSPTAAGDTVPETRSRRHGPGDTAAGDTVPETRSRRHGRRRHGPGDTVPETRSRRHGPGVHRPRPKRHFNARRSGRTGHLQSPNSSRRAPG